MSNTVYLKQPLKPEQLETILIKAANDVGWSLERKDKYKTSYKLGSLKEIRELAYSEIHLFRRGFLGRKIKKMEITGVYPAIFPELKSSEFKIYRDRFLGCSVNDKEVKQFLEKVGQYTDFFDLLGKVGNYL